MEKNRKAHSSVTTIVLRKYKKEQITLPLQDLCFVQRKDRNVTAFTNDGKEVNLYSRKLSHIRNLIENQELQYFFYMNSKIIVSYHFIDYVIRKYCSFKQIVKYFETAGLRIGRNELINMISSFENTRIAW